MQLFLEAVNITAILLILFMLTRILKQQPSRAQTAFILYNVFTMVFVVGIHLELIHSDTVGEALSGLCVQYAGQAGLLMSLLWFVSEFATFYIPVWVYGLEAVCNAFVVVGVFTAEKHRLFYASMEILTDGMYNRIKVGPGILWYIHFLHVDLVVLTILILCAVRYQKSTPTQKKRILYIAGGIGVLAGTLILKRAGLFGSYNPIVIAMTFNMFCMMMAMVRYGYFGSLHAAVDNAFNHGNEGLIILDEEDTVVFVNQRMDEFFPDIHKGSAIGSYQEIRELMESGEHLLRGDGTVYELRIEDIIENGEKNGRMLWLVDQTQQFLTVQKLSEADEAKTQFLMNVSHELRTPMNTMLGMNEMILRESGDGKIIGYAKEVAEAGAHMLSLIDEVLDASRLDSGTLTISKSPYQISGVLKKAEALTRPLAENKRIDFIVWADSRLTEEDSFQVGDATRILQVLVNLLSNAVKYTDSGFVRLEGRIRQERGSRWLMLSVRDSGMGIREEEMARIFESFGRGSNVGRRDGLGLGLAIAKQLVEVMGGTLAVDSKPGKGSVFTISLPWVEATGEELAAWKEKERESGEAAPSAGEKDLADFHTKTILAVDDNERNLLVLKHLLKRTKAVVETATDGMAAVEACARKKYDLILLDHMMPEMDGIATLHEIREDRNGKNGDTKVIALTANAGKGAGEMYLSEGFADYVSKPVDPGRLEQLLLFYLGTEQKESQPESENAGKEIPAESGWLEQLERGGIHTREGLRYADDDEAFYQKLLVLFAGQQEKSRRKLEDIWWNIEKQPDVRDDGSEKSADKALWNAWVAFCHGQKGEARGLGAQALGEYFYQLELAGRGKNKEQIEEIYPSVVREWGQVVKAIELAVIPDGQKETPLS